jgi:predicted Zn-dependent protease
MSISASDSEPRQVAGHWFDAQRSAPCPAVLSRTAEGLWVVRTDGTETMGTPAEVRVTDRIGTIPRRLCWPDGTEFESLDNDGIDALLGTATGRSLSVHRLESGWGIAVGAVVLLVALSALFIEYGLPALSAQIARLVPPRVEVLLGTTLVEWVDTALLRDSSLDEATQERLTKTFATLTSTLDDRYAYRLLFRDGAIGANAMALPGGTVIVTDDLVALAAHDEEILAVLAHEIGHVRGRHTLRHLVQASGVSALAVVVLGDLSQITALAAAAPALLEMRYARDLEREADQFARDWLRTNGIAETRFDDMLCRLHASRPEEGTSVPPFMSSHPALEERARCTESSSPAQEETPVGSRASDGP